MKDSIPLIWATYSLAETRNDMVVAGLGEDQEDFNDATSSCLHDGG